MARRCERAGAFPRAADLEACIIIFASFGAVYSGRNGFYLGRGARGVASGSWKVQPTDAVAQAVPTPGFLDVLYLTKPRS